MSNHAASPVSLGSGGHTNMVALNGQHLGERTSPVQDVAMRVKKYKQNQYHQNQQASGINMVGAHNSTRNKTSSQRGLSDLLRNQNGNNK